MTKIQSGSPKTTLASEQQDQIRARAQEAVKAIVALEEADRKLLEGQLPGTPTGFAQALVGGAFDRAIDQRFLQNPKVDVLRQRIVNGESAERLNDLLTDVASRVGALREALLDAKAEAGNPLLEKELGHSLANIALAANKRPEAFDAWVDKLEALAAKSNMAGRPVKQALQYGSNLAQLVAAELRTMTVEPLKQDPDLRNQV